VLSFETELRDDEVAKLELVVSKEEVADTTVVNSPYDVVAEENTCGRSVLCRVV